MAADRAVEPPDDFNASTPLMKAKHIRMIIGNKIDRWTATIDDKELADLIQKNTIVTGGCITSMLINEPVNDFDVYFRTKEVALKVAHYYVSKFKSNPPTLFKDRGAVDIRVDGDLPDRVKIIVKSAGVAGEGGSDSYQYFETLPPDAGEEAADAFMQQAMGNMNGLEEHTAEDIDSTEDAKSVKPGEKKVDERPKYRPVFLSSNAITLSDKLQIVVRFFGEPDDIHGNYDFVHCCNHWTSWDRDLTLRQDALEAILAKDLRYVGSKYPICSLIRARKFIKRGWNINAGQFLKMSLQISKLNLDDINTLEEQLVGVDAAYFTQLIEALRKKDPNVVDRSYITTLLDRIF